MAFNHIAHDYSPANSLFKRCVQCPNIAPTCPNCKSDEQCVTQLGDCNTCAANVCVKNAASGALPATAGKSSDGPNLGAIIGGVIGGVAFIAIAVFCIWKFWLKGRRHDVEVEEEWDDPDYPLEKPNGSVFTREARSRASTHTVASMASTVLTRASNIIQIAYIPGVTNRSNSSDPTLLVPPVPPIPSATTPSSLNSQFEDQHFFMPGDLRDTMYSDTSRMSTATSEPGARRPGSIAPSLARSSVASTIFRDSAVINPMPAQHIISAKPAMVSVIKGNSPLSTPPVPAVDFAKHGGNAVKPIVVQMPSSGGRSSNSTSATSSLRTMKPVALNIIRKDKSTLSPASAETSSIASSTTRVPSSQSKHAADAGFQNRSPNRMTKDSLAPSEMSMDTHRRARQSGYTHRSSRQTTYSDASDDEAEHERSRRSLLDKRQEATASPFTDAAEVKTPTTPTAPKDALTPQRGTTKESVAKGKSPFEDENGIDN